jgi:hypothetical protein
VTEREETVDIQKARLDPDSVFSTPKELCEHPGLTLEQKVEILQRLVYDASGLAVAE